MDSGIKGTRALVCAGSKALGKGCAITLAAEGVNLTIIAWQRLNSIPAGRFGDPLEFDRLCACITGQNFLIDGGSCPGTL